MNLHKVLECVGIITSLATVFVDWAVSLASYSVKTGLGVTENKYQNVGQIFKAAIYIKMCACRQHIFSLYYPHFICP